MPFWLRPGAAYVESRQLVLTAEELRSWSWSPVGLQLVRIRDRAQAQMLRFAQEFGLTPAARAHARWIRCCATRRKTTLSLECRDVVSVCERQAMTAREVLTSPGQRC